MGLFSGIKANLCKAKAAVVIEKLLENQAKFGLFPTEEASPAAMANKLVEVTWDRNPGIAASGFPHKMSLAAASLSSGVLAMDQAGNHEVKLALLTSLGAVLMELLASGNQLKLHSLDLHLIEKAEGVYAHFSEKSPLIR